MKMDSNTHEFAGTVKFAKGFGKKDCPDWRTGRIIFTKRENGWKLEVLLDVKGENAVLAILFKPQDILACKCSEVGLYVKVQQSSDAVVVNFRPNNNRAKMKELKAVSQEIKSHSTEAPLTRSEVGLSNTNLVKTASRKALFTSIGNTTENMRSNGKQENQLTESPQSVKENTRNHDDVNNGDFKENINSTPYRSNGEKFLSRGIDRSKQNLDAFGAKAFYSSTPQQSNLSSSAGWLNSTKRPGLMPSPTPLKRPRLSNSIPYSMKARATTEEQKQPQTLQGFSNLGNTCYMNAILQSLFGLDTFTADLLTSFRKLHRSMSPQSLYYSLAKLVHSRKQNLNDETRRDLLRKVKSAISASAKRFSGYGQHDAHEFLGQVLDQLKEEVVKINKSTPSPVRETAEEKETETDCVNPTTINFEFEVMHTITCLQCQEEVSKVEQFHDVSVDLPKRKDILTPRSLQDSLSIFFKKEEIEYTCEKCGHNKSEVSHKFTRLPRVFIIHLKRYTYDQTFLRNTKMAQNIRIPSYLTLESHCEETTQPAFPIQLQHVYHNKETAFPTFDDKKDDTPKRKLDFPGYTFNRKGLTPSSTVNGTSNDNNSSVSETGNQHKDKEEEGENLLKPLAEEEDSELARAIEMSLKEHVEREQLSRDFGEDNDSNFQKALEMSRHEEQPETKANTTNIEDLTEEQQLELAIQQSLMETDPYHHSNYTCNDDVTNPYEEHAYAGQFDIGPDEKVFLKSKHNEKVRKTSFCNENGSESNNKTAETDDIIKVCSSAVMSSNDAQPVSPGVFSDSGSEVFEFFHESDGSQKLTKIEDRSKLENKSNEKEKVERKVPLTSKYFTNVKVDDEFNDDYAEIDQDSMDKLPGGGKNDRKINVKSENKSSQDTASSDTDDHELIIENEFEYKQNTNKWFDSSFRSYSKKENRTKNKQVDREGDNSGKRHMGTVINDRSPHKRAKEEILDEKRTSENENLVFTGTNGQYARKCQLGTENKSNETGISSKHYKTETEDDNLEIYLKSEHNLFNDERNNTVGSVHKTPSKTPAANEGTPNRHRYGPKLEDISRKMDEYNKTELQTEKTEYRDKLLEEMNEKLDSTVKTRNGLSKKDKGKRADVDKDIYDFQCNEDDSWMNMLEDKENKYPKTQRPVLSDPSDVFDNGKTTNGDEIDGYIDANLDIPEINNEKGDLPYSYQLVSVVSHMGMSSSTGHYISDVYDINKRSWFSFDDSHVSKISESEMKSKRERSGYIFFYMSKDIFDDLCLHESVVSSERKKEPH